MIFVTDLVTFLYCPRRLFAIKRLGYKEPTTREMIFGTVVHEVAEQLAVPVSVLRSLSDGESCASVEEKLQQYGSRVLSKVIVRHKGELESTGWVLMECFRGARAAVDGYAVRHARLIHACLHERGAVSVLPAVSERFRVEVPIESKVLQLKGRIDELHVDGSVVVPVELKTGRAPKEGVWKHHQVQLAAYALLLEEQGFVAREAKVEYVMDRVSRPVFMNPFLKEEVQKLAHEVREMVHKTAVPAKGCGECDACKVLESRLANSLVSVEKSAL